MLETKMKNLKLISILLGLIGIANMILLGIYVVNYCLLLATLLSKFLLEANIIEFATTISIALILFGSYSIYKNHPLRGGICNLIAGTITIAIYLHYALNVPILQQFGLLGYFLLLPAPISGIIGVIISKMKTVY